MDIVLLVLVIVLLALVLHGQGMISERLRAVERKLPEPDPNDDDMVITQFDYANGMVVKVVKEKRIQEVVDDGTCAREG